MLASFRRHLDSWVAKTFFALLVGVFVLWGVGDVILKIGEDPALVTVGGKRIELPEIQDAYRRQLAQVTRMFGGKIDPTPEMKKSIAAQAVEQVVTATAMAQATAALGIAAPDDAIRQSVFDMPAFKGADGKFDKNAFAIILRNNNLSEGRFLAMMKDDLAERQLTEPIRASAISPDILTREVYAFQDETRVADAVALSFAAAPPPEAPTEAQLQRWHDNHLDQYSTPEYRRIKIVLLSPEIVGKDIPISEDDITQAYNARRAEFRQPERRSVQVLLAADEAEASKLAEIWRAGADWAAMQKANASAVELPDATQDSFPAPELGAAAFAAPVGVVAPPVKSALGWHVFKVTDDKPGVDKSLAEVHDALRSHLVADKAADLVFERSAKIEDLLAGGTPLDELPGDFGLAAATGTLDARGLQPDGTPAPVPGDDATRQAIITAAFAAQKDQPAHLTEAPRDADGLQGYFAVVVEDITPPAPRPLADIIDSVRADWTRDARRHAQEEAATAIMTGVKAGKTLAEAAPGLTVTRLAPAGRASGGEGVPPQLVQPLFHLKPGEPTMVETLDGFTVAVLAQVNPPDAAAPAYGKTRDQLAEAVGNDMLVLLRIALRNRSNPKISATILDNVAQSE